jgi:hypothetical protein
MSHDRIYVPWYIEIAGPAFEIRGDTILDNRVTETWGEYGSRDDYTGRMEDTYTDQGNSGTYNMGATNLIRTGDNSGSRPVRIMINVDFSNILITDSSQIVSATLYLRNNDFEASGDHVDIFRVKKHWNGGNTDYAVPPEGDDAVTWTYQYSTQTAWTGAGCDNSADRETTAEDTQTISNQGVWYSWDVTDSAKTMFDNTQYYGWILISLLWMDPHIARRGRCYPEQDTFLQQ